MVADVGYDEVSLRLVAEELGLSKGTIVHHFGSKDRLLEELRREYMTCRLKESRAILTEFDGPRDQLTAFVAQLVLAQRDDRAATVAFAREITRFATLDLMSEVRSMRNEYSRLLRRRRPGRNGTRRVPPRQCRLDHLADFWHVQLGLDMDAPRRTLVGGRGRQNLDLDDAIRPRCERRTAHVNGPRRKSWSRSRRMSRVAKEEGIRAPEVIWDPSRFISQRVLQEMLLNLSGRCQGKLIKEYESLGPLEWSHARLP